MKLEDSYLSSDDLMTLFNIRSKQTIANWVKAGILPPPVRLSRKCVRWTKSDIATAQARFAAEARE